MGDIKLAVLQEQKKTEIVEEDSLLRDMRNDCENLRHECEMLKKSNESLRAQIEERKFFKISASGENYKKFSDVVDIVHKTMKEKAGDLTKTAQLMDLVNLLDRYRTVVTNIESMLNFEYPSKPV